MHRVGAVGPRSHEQARPAGVSGPRDVPNGGFRCVPRRRSSLPLDATDCPLSRSAHSIKLPLKRCRPQSVVLVAYTGDCSRKSRCAWGQSLGSQWRLLAGTRVALLGSGGQREDVTESSVTGIAPRMTRLFGTVTPEPDNTLTRHAHRHRWARLNAPQTTTNKSHLTQRGFDTERPTRAPIGESVLALPAHRGHPPDRQIGVA